MKRVFVFSAVLLGLFATADAAQAPNPRGARGGASNGTTTTVSSARSAVSARSGVTAPTSTSGRTGATGRTTVSRGTGTSGGASVVARAGTKQKVIGAGTKVASATKNVVVSEACQQKYDGCMDSFCMVDNDNGGRCICSDRNAELDSVLAEIEKLDQQSYQMATVGVEKIEMGADADAVMANVNSVVNALDKENSKTSARKSLNLDLWNTTFDDSDDDIWSSVDSVASSVDGKTGDSLYRAANSICVAQMPECGSELSMLQLMYSQRIKSDCNAYENSLKQQKNASANKLASAQQAMREAALEQYRSANKYDLGQCTTEFKKCMINTGGCGSDFANCASVAASDNTNVNKSRRGKSTTYSIKGATTTIEISSSTYDTLYAKKPLCENVTKQCVAVADQVWDTFLREVAPQVKSAELIAENNIRQSCIGTISECFQKACKDTIDPNDPDGSYDMCLSRPETMLNVCKIPLNACGIDASSAAKAEGSQIWQYVVARLASMRADACTTEVKECLQSTDRCGKDYSQCVGLDTDTIVRMCPTEKLTACVQKYKGNTSDLDEYLSSVAQGIMLDIDNSMLTQCQNAADEAMIKVCGDTENCDGLALDDGLGGRSLEYKICKYSTSDDNMNIDYSNCRTDVSQIRDSELGRVAGSTTGELGAVTPLAGVLDGTIYWENIDFDDDGKLSSFDDYLSKIDATGMSDAQKEKVKSELAVLQRGINNAIATIEADPTVQYCMTGRRVQGLTRTTKTDEGVVRNRTSFGSDEGRFTGLTQQMRMKIATSALKKAKANYYAKYDELNTKMLQDYATIGERVAEMQNENSLDSRREIARIACTSFAEGAALPRSANPPKGAFGKVLAATAVAAAAVAIPFTGGASAVVIGVAAGGVAGIGLSANAGSDNANGSDDGAVSRDLVGTKQVNQWNYKEVITATFEWDTLNCHKCTRVQQCSKTRRPWFGNKYCQTWEEPVETCTDTQF